MGSHISEDSEIFRRVLDSIRRIVRALRVSSRHSERQAGLSGAQLFVLQSLSDVGAMTVNELAARTFTHQSTVSVVANGLARRGLVLNERASGDGRRRALKLSPAGMALLRRSSLHPAQHQLLKGLEKLPAHMRRQLAGLLESVIAAAGWSGADPTLFFEREMPASRRKLKSNAKRKRQP